MNRQTWLLMTGPQKTAFLREWAIAHSTDPLVRQTAVLLVNRAGRDDHLERLRRLHAFVRDSVPYHRESVEMFQHPSLTLRQGGDCDDHAALLFALAWSLRYPFHLQAIGHPEGPAHYTGFLGWPPGESPYGDAGTRWLPAETTIDALFGEGLRRAQERLFA